MSPLALINMQRIFGSLSAAPISRRQGLVHGPGQCIFLVRPVERQNQELIGLLHQNMLGHKNSPSRFYGAVLRSRTTSQKKKGVPIKLVSTPSFNSGPT